MRGTDARHSSIPCAVMLRQYSHGDARTVTTATGCTHSLVAEMLLLATVFLNAYPVGRLTLWRGRVVLWQISEL